MAESPIEKLFREAAERIWPDDPKLVQEHEVRGLGDGRSFRRLDFALPSLMLGIELDGHATHSSPTNIADDRRRQRALEDAGWRVRRYGGAEVLPDAEGCVRDALRWAGLVPKPLSTLTRLKNIELRVATGLLPMAINYCELDELVRSIVLDLQKAQRSLIRDEALRDRAQTPPPPPPVIPGYTGNSASPPV